MAHQEEIVVNGVIMQVTTLDSSAQEVDDTVKNFPRHAAQHAADGEDPLTLKMLGAAPAGFGLGENLPTYDDPDAIGLLQSGFFAFLNATAPIEGQAGGIILNLNGNERTVSNSNRQFFFPTIMNCYLIRESRGGVWYPWEWVNPPMKLGVEYRTTERYLGKPVYAKLVDFGALPATANTNKSVAHGATDVDKVIFGMFTDSTGVLYTTYDNTINFVITRTGISVKVVTISTSTATVWMKYTKTTD